MEAGPDTDEIQTRYRRNIDKIPTRYRLGADEISRYGLDTLDGDLKTRYRQRTDEISTRYKKIPTRYRRVTDEIPTRYRQGIVKIPSWYIRWWFQKITHLSYLNKVIFWRKPQAVCSLLHAVLLWKHDFAQNDELAHLYRLCIFRWKPFAFCSFYLLTLDDDL